MKNSLRRNFFNQGIGLYYLIRDLKPSKVSLPLGGWALMK